MACIRPGIASFGVFPPEKTLRRDIGGVWMACFVAVVPESVAVVVCRSNASGRVDT